MLARCPHCSVAHVVTRPPGNESHGHVRCEACGRAFAFFPALEIAPAGEPVSGPGVQPVRRLHEYPRTPTDSDSDCADAAPTTASRASGNPDAPTRLSASTPEWNPSPEPEPEHPAPADSPERAHASAPAAPAPSLRTRSRRSRARSRGAMLAGLLLLGLIFQLLTFPPRAITQEPALETLRSSLCDRLRCPERGHRAPESVRVSSPSLHPAGAGSGRWLIFELYNHESRAQAWPLLDIALSDTLGRTHARERIHPRVYAPGDDPPLQMAAHLPWPVALRIRTEHPRLSGVHVRPR